MIKSSRVRSTSKSFVTKLISALFVLSFSTSTYAAITGIKTFPAGHDKEVQYNNNGIFGASTTFTFDKVTGILHVPKIQFPDGTVLVSSPTSSGGGSGGPLTADSTFYIQNTNSPTTADQVFNVSRGIISGYGSGGFGSIDTQIIFTPRTSSFGSSDHMRVNDGDFVLTLAYGADTAQMEMNLDSTLGVFKFFGPNISDLFGNGSGGTVFSNATVVNMYYSRAGIGYAKSEAASPGDYYMWAADTADFLFGPTNLFYFVGKSTFSFTSTNSSLVMDTNKIQFTGTSAFTSVSTNSTTATFYNPGINVSTAIVQIVGNASTLRALYLVNNSTSISNVVSQTFINNGVTTAFVESGLGFLYLTADTQESGFGLRISSSNRTVSIADIFGSSTLSLKFDVTGGLNDGTINWNPTSSRFEISKDVQLSSVTISTGNVTRIRWADGTVQVSSPTSGSIVVNVDGSINVVNTSTVSINTNHSNTFTATQYISSAMAIGNGPAAAAATMQAGYGASNYFTGDQLDYIFYEYWDMPDGTRVFSSSNTVASPHVTIGSDGDAVLLGWTIGANNPAGYRVVRIYNGDNHYYADINPNGAFPIDDNGFDLFFWTYDDGDPIPLTPAAYSFENRYGYNALNGKMYGVYSNGSAYFDGDGYFGKGGSFGALVTVSSSIYVTGQGLFPGNVRIGNPNPGDTSSSLSFVGTGASTEQRIAFFEETQNTTRGEFTLANSGDGSWTFNFISIMNHGSAYANDYYTDDDAGASIFLLQGVNASKMAFDTYNGQPIHFYVGQVKREVITSTGTSFVGNVTANSNLSVAGIVSVSTLTASVNILIGTGTPQGLITGYQTTTGRGLTFIQAGKTSTLPSLIGVLNPTASAEAGMLIENGGPNDYGVLRMHGTRVSTNDFLGAFEFGDKTSGADPRTSMILGYAGTASGRGYMKFLTRDSGGFDTNMELQEGGGVFMATATLTAATITTLIGSSATITNFNATASTTTRLNVTDVAVLATTTINGKLTVTGAIDPYAVIVASTSLGGVNVAYYEAANGSATTVSPSNRGRMIYDSANQSFRMSLNGGGYVNFASTAPATHIVLAGTGTARGQVGGIIFDHYVSSGNSTTVETDLYTDIITTSTLVNNGDSIIARYSGSAVGSTSSKQFKVYFTTTAVFDSGAVAIGTGGAFDIDVFVIKTGASTARVIGKMNTAGASTQVYTQYTDLSGVSFAANNTLRLTGTASGVGAASSDIVAKIGKIRWEPGSP